ncbi:hypothetical protein [Kineococcus radiotolerans]|uniref:Uncharacterized protein n=1 Tax=Kineococcus radiotolerans (strain ATCC BAA-149 / DSM 14245 / SRS30216) TaxID=266940 RepID=A6WAM4_KINRD|nr:hypothetical protein [Kineococcus radiotolerans]ABS03863.1 hypothetical protein Krad_2383 [Kineococcus radiotolerans SRS30216 = ATCC BAA-149]
MSDQPRTPRTTGSPSPADGQSFDASYSANDASCDASHDASHDASDDAAFDVRLRDRLTATSSTPPDPVFRAALRRELQRTVATTVTEHRRGNGPWGRWSRRRTLTLSAVLAVGLAGGGAAVASGVLPLPGADQVVLRTPASTVVHTGTTTIDLGERPSGVTSVELTLTCLSVGSLTFDDGAGLTCAPEDVVAEDVAVENVAAEDVASNAATPTPGLALPHRGSAGYTLPLTTGQTSTTITATAGTRWALTTAYSTHTPTDWATNANGDTYGVSKTDGSGDPDLIAVAAQTSTGEQGYVYARDLQAGQPTPTSPEEAATWAQNHPATPHDIPVYASDGSTVIGQFEVP